MILVFYIQREQEMIQASVKLPVGFWTVHFRIHLGRLPLKLASSYSQMERTRICPGGKNQTLQFIPPEFPAHISCANENCCWNIILFQDWFGSIEIIGIPVIKCDSHRFRRQKT